MDNLDGDYQSLTMEKYKIRERGAYSSVRMLGIYMDRIPDFQTNMYYDHDVADIDPEYMTGNKAWESYQRFVNKDALNDAKVLIIRDSFTTFNAELYETTFSDVRLVHYDEILFDTQSDTNLVGIIEDMKPDIVIFEMVERFVNELSDMDPDIIPQ